MPDDPHRDKAATSSEATGATSPGRFTREDYPRLKAALDDEYKDRFQAIAAEFEKKYEALRVLCGVEDDKPPAASKRLASGRAPHGSVGTLVANALIALEEQQEFGRGEQRFTLHDVWDVIRASDPEAAATLNQASLSSALRRLVEDRGIAGPWIEVVTTGRGRTPAGYRFLSETEALAYRNDPFGRGIDRSAVTAQRKLVSQMTIDQAMQEESARSVSENAETTNESSDPTDTDPAE